VGNASFQKIEHRLVLGSVSYTIVIGFSFKIRCCLWNLQLAFFFFKWDFKCLPTWYRGYFRYVGSRYIETDIVKSLLSQKSKSEIHFDTLIEMYFLWYDISHPLTHPIGYQNTWTMSRYSTLFVVCSPTVKWARHCGVFSECSLLPPPSFLLLFTPFSPRPLKKRWETGFVYKSLLVFQAIIQHSCYPPAIETIYVLRTVLVMKNS